MCLDEWQDHIHLTVFLSIRVRRGRLSFALVLMKDRICLRAVWSGRTNLLFLVLRSIALVLFCRYLCSVVSCSMCVELAATIRHKPKLSRRLYNTLFSVSHSLSPSMKPDKAIVIHHDLAKRRRDMASSLQMLQLSEVCSTNFDEGSAIRHHRHWCHSTRDLKNLLPGAKTSTYLDIHPT